VVAFIEKSTKIFQVKKQVRLVTAGSSKNGILKWLLPSFKAAFGQFAAVAL